MKTQHLALLILVTLLCINCIAQNDAGHSNPLLRDMDYVYIDEVKTVQFHIVGQPLSAPIMQLGSTVLELSFDDLSEEVYDYTYEIIHCNADWTRSELTEIEYLSGFNNEIIQNYTFSRNTLTNYIHYSLTIPNANTSITKSGNYLLHIYENGDPELPIITRRFMVVENMMQILPQFARVGSVGKALSHHEIDFTVVHKSIQLVNPYSEIKAVVMQNNRWDNAITGLQPLFIKEEQLVYDYQGKINFAAGKEFRNFNTQSLRFRTERVARIIEDPVDKFHVELFSDLDRSLESYVFFNDLNGRYVIQNDDQNVNDRLGADYAWVHFSIQMPQSLENGDLYLFGGLTDWRIQEPFKLQYLDKEQVYVGRAFLKQGYYDYVYAFVPNGSDQPDCSLVEGNSYETENNYQILIYYRPMGGRYDRLAAVTEINSTR